MLSSPQESEEDFHTVRLLSIPDFLIVPNGLLNFGISE